MSLLPSTSRVPRAGSVRQTQWRLALFVSSSSALEADAEVGARTASSRNGFTARKNQTKQKLHARSNVRKSRKVICCTGQQHRLICFCWTAKFWIHCFTAINIRCGVKQA